MSEWYIQQPGGTEQGQAIPLDCLLSQIQAGEIPPAVMVRPASGQKWMRADALLQRARQLQSKPAETQHVEMSVDPARPVLKEQAVFDALGIDDSAPPAIDEEVSTPPAFRPLVKPPSGIVTLEAIVRWKSA